MKCILHIGGEKTGSTTLQACLYELHDALRGVGLDLLPANNFGGKNNRQVPARFCGLEDDFFVGRCITNEAERRAFNSDFDVRFSQAARSIRDTGAETVVITSEHFHSRLRDKNSKTTLLRYLSRYFEAFEIIYYAREQGSLVVSHYLEALKHGERRPLREWAVLATPDNYYYNPVAVASGWAEVFGRENLKCFIYDDVCESTEGLIGHFLQTIQASPTSASLHKRENSSLNAGQAALARLFNNLSPHSSLAATEVYIKNLPSDILGKLPTAKVISYSLQQEVASRFSSVNEEFCERFAELEASKMRYLGPKKQDGHSDYQDIDAVVDSVLSFRAKTNSKPESQHSMRVSDRATLEPRPSYEKELLYALNRLAALLA